MTWCSYLDTYQTPTEQMLGHTRVDYQNGKKYAQHHIRQKDQHLGQGEDNSNQQFEKNEVVLGRAYQPPQRRPMDLTWHHVETESESESEIFIRSFQTQETSAKTITGRCRRGNDKKRRQGSRSAKRWRDDMDKYWSDTSGRFSHQTSPLSTLLSRGARQRMPLQVTNFLVISTPRACWYRCMSTTLSDFPIFSAQRSNHGRRSVGDGEDASPPHFSAWGPQLRNVPPHFFA